MRSRSGASTSPDRDRTAVTGRPSLGRMAVTISDVDRRLVELVRERITCRERLTAKPGNLPVVDRILALTRRIDRLFEVRARVIACHLDREPV